MIACRLNHTLPHPGMVAFWVVWKTLALVTRSSNSFVWFQILLTMFWLQNIVIMDPLSNSIHSLVTLSCPHRDTAGDTLLFNWCSASKWIIYLLLALVEMMLHLSFFILVYLLKHGSAKSY
jgi:hypothetical protein